MTDAEIDALTGWNLSIALHIAHGAKRYHTKPDNPHAVLWTDEQFKEEVVPGKEMSFPLAADDAPLFADLRNFVPNRHSDLSAAMVLALENLIDIHPGITAIEARVVRRAAWVNYRDFPATPEGRRQAVCHAIGRCFLKNHPTPEAS